MPIASAVVGREVRGAARWRLCAWVFLGLVLVLRLATFLDYGVTWDEQTARRNGGLTLRWYGSGMRDAAFLADRDQHLYGSFFNVLVRPVCRRSPLGYYDTQHLLITLVGFLITVIVYITAADLAGPLAGLLAAIFVTLTPSFYGHSFNNPKDVPFAALFALAVLLIVRGVSEPLSWRRMVTLGAVIGLAAGVRMVGLSLLALALLPAIANWRRATPSSTGRPRVVLRLALALMLLCGVAWCVMLIWWPYVQLAPLSHTWEVLRGASHFSWFSRTTLFEGRELRPSELPRTYALTWLTMSLPEFYLVAAACGLGAWVARRRRQRATRAAALRAATVLLAAAGPLAAVLVLRPMMYDGIRHLLFVLPLLAVLAGTATALYVREARRVWRWLGAGALLVLMTLTAVDMVRLHPYQYVYFNRVAAGGLAGADGRFETDYWGVSYKEAVQWLQRHYRPDSRGIRVANCSEPFLSAYELAKAPRSERRFIAVPAMETADVVLATTRWGCQRAQPGRVVHVVERLGVGLCYVIERRPPSQPRATENGRGPHALGT